MTRLRRFGSCIAVVVALSATPSALAQESVSFVNQVLSVLVPVLVVLGALLAALILVNRRRGLYKSSGPLRIVQVLPMGSRERVVVLDTGTQQFVLGVTSSQITLLSILDSTACDQPE